MAQFDVFENPNQETNQAVPYLLDIQADLLDGLYSLFIHWQSNKASQSSVHNKEPSKNKHSTNKPY